MANTGMTGIPLLMLLFLAREEHAHPRLFGSLLSAMRPLMGQREERKSRA